MGYKEEHGGKQNLLCIFQGDGGAILGIERCRSWSPRWGQSMLSKKLFGSGSQELQNLLTSINYNGRIKGMEYGEWRDGKA